MKHLFSLLIMLVIGIFLMQPAYAQLAPASQPVLSAVDLVLVDANVAMPTALDEISITVAPANLPGHLSFADSLYSRLRQDYITVAYIGHNKGGFQSIEIVRLGKSALSNKSNDPTADPKHMRVPNIPNGDGIGALGYKLVSGIREVATIIKGPSLTSTNPVAENNSLDSTGSPAPSSSMLI